LIFFLQQLELSNEEEVEVEALKREAEVEQEELKMRTDISRVDDKASMGIQIRLFMVISKIIMMHI
jgi:hypothetical protein